jgi:hypothetical protein
MKNTFRIIHILLALSLITSCKSNQDGLPVLIEITDSGYRIADKTFKNFCLEQIKDTSHLYQWENHHLFYVAADQAENIKIKLETAFPDASVKIFKSPMYVFDSEKNCGKKKLTECKDYVFTANLVADSAKQREYMNYHAHQAQDWPEVARGFCEADFQKLLVYRSGRQLILIISIPADKTLEELNPKTVKNNPKMIEWNKIMATYQEGIELAPAGVVWVQFEKISVRK